MVRIAILLFIMAGRTTDPRGRVHLVGSVPLTDAETVMRTASTVLGAHLSRLPDGETGVRANFINWQWRNFAENPLFEVCAPAAGDYVQRPRVRLRPGAAPVRVGFGALGCAEYALGSYAVFERLQRAQSCRQDMASW